jgi:NAD(P)H-dependent flavin oxidoreductase YrpB (nitropropane dioxygenase family)
MASEITMSEIRKRASERMGQICKVCKVCDGRICAGEVPGMGGIGTGASFMRNVDSLGEVKVNMRTLHGVKEADCSISLFGHHLLLPVLGAPVAGVKINFQERIGEYELAHAMVSGCLDAGTIGMTGDGGDPNVYQSGIEALHAFGGCTIPVVKPGPNDQVISKFKVAEEAGAIAVGMDVDAACFVNMKLLGATAGPKTDDELKALIGSTRLPVIIKGIMTPDEAELAAKCGAAGIVVSNHGGRVLDHTPGVADVLSEVAKPVKGKLVVLADGGIRRGVDVLKCLALGADAVLVGRPLTIGAFGGGREGVRCVLTQIQSELETAMILTGCASTRDIGPRVITSI